MENIISVEHLKKYFPIKRGVFKKTVGYVKAVDDVSFTLAKKRALGIVGESGCGKTTLARTVLRLLEPDGGNIIYEGKDISHITEDELQGFRKKIQIVFQDPNASLNGRMRIGRIIDRAMVLNTSYKKYERREKILSLLEKVGLLPEHFDRFPHELSGGQQQRVGIARALSVEPNFLVLDEPTSALDVSVQAQILNLLKKIQKEMGLTTLFISHNLSVIDHFCDRICVMYCGKIVEMADRETLFQSPTHPYTRALFSSVPNVENKKKIFLHGEIANPSNPPTGCRFHTRCPNREFDCDRHEPSLDEFGKGHYVACRYA
jgi:oligopeptide/dipeptide ABC transporter ATP-binding protein